MRHVIQTNFRMFKSNKQTVKIFKVNSLIAFWRSTNIGNKLTKSSCQITTEHPGTKACRNALCKTYEHIDGRANMQNLYPTRIYMSIEVYTHYTPRLLI